jgi:symplekin
MERAAEDEKSRRISAAAAAEAESRKRPLMVTTSTEEASDPKRQKLEQDGSAAALLAGFDFTSLPAALITELVVANLQAFTEPALIGLVQAYRTSRGMDVAPPAPSISAAGSSSEPQPPFVKEEPVDPLKMDIDEEELEYEPDRLNMEVTNTLFFLRMVYSDSPSQLSGHEYAGDPVLLGTDLLTPSLDLVDFKLPPPKELSEPDRLQLVQKTVERIWNNAQDGSVEMWMLLIVRMITRVTEPPEEKETDIENVEEGKEGEEGGEVDFYARQDRLRQVLCDYIMADFPSRYGSSFL